MIILMLDFSPGLKYFQIGKNNRIMLENQLSHKMVQTKNKNSLICALFL